MTLFASPRLRLIIEGLLVLLLLVMAGRLAMVLVAGPDVAASAPPAPLRADVAVLSRFDPFFRGAGPNHAAVSGEAGGWTLHAVRYGGGNFDTAIISGADNRQNVYRLGEELAPGLVLGAVGADHVELLRGGARSRLGFPEAGRAARRETDVRAEPVAAAPPTTVAAARFVAEAALSPRPEGGYALQPRGRGTTLAAAGLQAGDVLLSVNGMAMNAERAAELETELNAGETAELQFERDGRRHAVTLRIEPGTRR